MSKTLLVISETSSSQDLFFVPYNFVAKVKKKYLNMFSLANEFFIWIAVVCFCKGWTLECEVERAMEETFGRLQLERKTKS